MDKPNSTPGRALAAAELRRRCDPAQLAFSSTDELADLSDALGQARAVEAIRFGIEMPRDGYNLFAMGPEGLGRRTIVRGFLEQTAPAREVPDDWCYVFNFDTPHKPRALRLPPGRAPRFRQSMERLVQDLRAGIPAAFESDEHRRRRQEIESAFSEHQDKAVGEIGERAKDRGIALLRTPSGFGFAPTRKDEVMSPQEFHKLPADEQKRLEDAIAVLQADLERVIQDVPKWRREAQHGLRGLNRETTRNAAHGQIEELKAEYAALPAVGDYLTALEEDVLDHAEVFQQPKDGEQPTLFGIPMGRGGEESDTTFRRYRVNVLIEHAEAKGAPIVYEDNPAHDNLVGRTEHIAQMGTLVTDFTLIKAGALHRANGGYLILDALKVLTQPFAWEALKRALRAREIRTESLGQMLSLISTVSLEPEPIPLDVKVVLVGQRMIYYLLHDLDPEFGELFKVVVDFDEDMPREAGADLLYVLTASPQVGGPVLVLLDARTGAILDTTDAHGAVALSLADNLAPCLETPDSLELLDPSSGAVRFATALGDATPVTNQNVSDQINAIFGFTGTVTVTGAEAVYVSESWYGPGNVGSGYCFDAVQEDAVEAICTPSQYRIAGSRQRIFGLVSRAASRIAFVMI